MTKRSGYRVRIDAFLPADVNNPASILDAKCGLENAEHDLKAIGFITIGRKQKYFQSTEVNDGGGQVSLPTVGVEDTIATSKEEAARDIVSATSDSLEARAQDVPEPEVFGILPELRREKRA